MGLDVLDEEEDREGDARANEGVNRKKGPIEGIEAEKQAKEDWGDGLRGHRSHVIITGELSDFLFRAKLDDHREGIEVDKGHAKALKSPDDIKVEREGIILAIGDFRASSDSVLEDKPSR